MICPYDKQITRTHKLNPIQDVQLEIECPWQTQNDFDYIYKVPILIVLIVSISSSSTIIHSFILHDHNQLFKFIHQINIFFLCKIMWLLIIKLRTCQQHHNSTESKQYRKLAKALSVLIPLLGVGYMLLLVTPTHPTLRVIFKCLQAGLVSTQGFTVAVLYCFFNGEVRNSVKNHFTRFQMRRTLRHGRDYPKAKSYYKSTAGYHAYHHRNNSSRSSYAFQYLTSDNGGLRASVGCPDGGPLNGPINRRTSSGAGGGFSMNGDTPTHHADRFSNASDSVAASVRLYRSSGRGDKGRGDSCVSFTTTSSYVVFSTGSATGTSMAASMLANGNCGNASPSIQNVSRGTSIIVPSDNDDNNDGTIATVLNCPSLHKHSNGYHSIPSTPDEVDHRIHIELQPIETLS